MQEQEEKDNDYYYSQVNHAKASPYNETLLYSRHNKRKRQRSLWSIIALQYTMEVLLRHTWQRVCLHPQWCSCRMVLYQRTSPLASGTAPLSYATVGHSHETWSSAFPDYEAVARGIYHNKEKSNKTAILEAHLTYVIFHTL